MFKQREQLREWLRYYTVIYPSSFFRLLLQRSTKELRWKRDALKYRSQSLLDIAPNSTTLVFRLCTLEPISICL